MPTPKYDDLGLHHGTVALRDPTPRWSELYEEEAGRIRRALGDVALDVQHVGSTAVPGLRAKPILDIAVGVRRLDDAERYRAPLEALGYDYRPEAGVPNTVVFGRGTPRTHLVHVVAHDGPVWAGLVGFRDALRVDPELAQEYAALKEDLARKHPGDRAAYTEGKGSFVRAVVAAEPATAGRRGA